MTIKKVYTAVINLLEQNKDKKVSAVLADVIALCQVKQTRDRASQTYIKNTEGAVVAVRDFYFQRWMPLVGKQAVEFGEKKGSPTGLSPISKLGQSRFSAAKTKAQKEVNEFMARLANGETHTPEQIKAKLDEIQARRETPVFDKNEDGSDKLIGFATLEECVEYLKACKVKLPVDVIKPTVDKKAKAA